MSERRPVSAPVGALAVGLIAIVVFAPGLVNGFAYDDVPIVLGDARIRTLANLPAMLTGGYWQNSDLALYRPLTTLSFALDWSLAPSSAAWFHFTNVLLNAGAAVLAYLLLARIFGAGAALAGALIWTVHPVHVEAVTSIVGRSELLSALFLLGACVVWAYDTRERRGVPLPALLFALALFSKESAIMLPAALVLVDAATGRLDMRRPIEWLRRDARALTTVALIALGYLGVRFAVLGALSPTRVDPILEVAATPIARVLTALQAWPVWLRLMLVPRTLLADYGPRIIDPASGLTGGALAGLLIALALGIGGVTASIRGHGRVAFALLWLPVMVLPVSNLIVPIGVLVGERTLYLPSLSLAAGISALAAMPAAATGTRARVFRASVAAAALILVARVGMRIPEWNSTDTIMAALVRDRPDSFRGRWHAARVARMAEDAPSAIAQYDTAVWLWPHRRTLLMEAASYAATQGAFGRARAMTQLALRQWPGDIDAIRLDAAVALDTNDAARAADAVRAGLAIAPGDEVLRRMQSAIDSMATAAGSAGQ